MNTLLKTTIHIYIWTGVFLFAALFPYCDDTFNHYNLINILLFVSYVITLWCAIGKNEEYYSYGRLALTVFFYSLIFVFLYLDLSYYYTGNTFYWDYTDPYAYARMDQKIVDNEIAFFDMPDYIYENNNWEFDDWGASMAQTLFLNLIQSRYFLFVSQTFVGSVGAMLMFSLGKKIMQIDYAYMAALSYSISSYSIYYYSSYRKEIFMVFIVIVSFWCFYQYLSGRSKAFLILTAMSVTAMFFFRPALVFLMVAGMFSYFIMGIWNKGYKLPMIFVTLVVLGGSFTFLYSAANSFSNDLANSENYVDTSTFGIIVSTIGVLIGPFPQLLQLGVIKMSQLPLYGPGLLLKFILFLAFWNGFWICLKNKDATVLPLYVFTILEMLALAVVNDGLELRKAMPHISTFHIAAFWFISKYDERAAQEDSALALYPLPKAKPEIVLFGIAVFVFVSTFAWDTMR